MQWSLRNSSYRTEQFWGHVAVKNEDPPWQIRAGNDCPLSQFGTYFKEKLTFHGEKEFKFKLLE